jgi:antitoxin HicB
MTDTFTFAQREDAVWTAQVMELPGVIAEGDTPDEAITEGREALSEMIACYLDEGRSVPEPFETREFSGCTELRPNPELHGRVMKMAAEQGVNLNRWFTAVIATAAGRHHRTARRTRRAYGTGRRRRTYRGAEYCRVACNLSLATSGPPPNCGSHERCYRRELGTRAPTPSGGRR